VLHHVSNAREDFKVTGAQLFLQLLLNAKDLPLGHLLRLQ
jgi:hypothetical protein